MAIEIIYVEEEVLDWLNIHKSPMPMACMETNSHLGYAEFKVLSDCNLTLKQFHVVLLYYFCGKSEREVGRIMKIDRSTVNEHLMYSKKKILKKLTKNA